MIQATASTTKSAPSCAGLSVKIESPVFMPGPITRMFESDSLFIACFITLVKEGTTEEVKVKREAEEKARREAEKKARREAEEKARREREERARREATEKDK